MEKCLNQTICVLNGLKWLATFPTQCWGLTAQGGSAFTISWDTAEWISPEGNESEIEY